MSKDKELLQALFDICDAYGIDEFISLNELDSDADRTPMTRPRALKS
jgi:hypothetical protein